DPVRSPPHHDHRRQPDQRAAARRSRARPRGRHHRRPRHPRRPRRPTGPVPRHLAAPERDHRVSTEPATTHDDIELAPGDWTLVRKLAPYLRPDALLYVVAFVLAPVS